MERERERVAEDELIPGGLAAIWNAVRKGKSVSRVLTKFLQAAGDTLVSERYINESEHQRHHSKL